MEKLGIAGIFLFGSQAQKAANQSSDFDFADTALQNMAGYRNRIVHFYADITAEEIYKIINENLEDFNTF